MNPIIIGAGLSGLLAATLIPNAHVYEKGLRDQRAHKALLRFRSAAVGDALGIPFRKVTVRKGLFYQGEFVQPNIRLANMYAQKVIGRTTDRSIWKLETQERFIAPENLAEQLIDRLGKRINWNTPISSATGSIDRERDRPIISTAPMNVNLQLSGLFRDMPGIEFSYAPITVHRWRIRDCDVHQTIYFPSHTTALYRASITGDLLIAEFVQRAPYHLEADLHEIYQAFGLDSMMLEKLDVSEQRFGKIAPIDNDLRKRVIRQLTLQHNFYSLGRFATWRNILLDDVLHDVYVIKKLLNANEYDAARIAVGADR